MSGRRKDENAGGKINGEMVLFTLVPKRQELGLGHLAWVKGWRKEVEWELNEGMEKAEGVK